MRRFFQYYLASLAMLVLLSLPTVAQSDNEINLAGAIDFHAHQAPDVIPRAMDALDEAKLDKKMGMRGIVMKNHYVSTADIVDLVRKETPNFESFGGIALNKSVGGLNLEAIKIMATTTGGYGRVIWFPTKDAENRNTRAKGPEAYVHVVENDKLVPAAVEILDYIVLHPQLVLETGHLIPEQGLLLVQEAHARGIEHIVVTHAVDLGWTVPQMQEAAKDGAFLEFVYKSTQYPKSRESITGFVTAMKAVGPEHCVLGTDYGEVWTPPLPLEPQGFLDFMVALHKAGMSVADINEMGKANPAQVLGLHP